MLRTCLSMVAVGLFTLACGGDDGGGGDGSSSGGGAASGDWTSQAQVSVSGEVSDSFTASVACVQTQQDYVVFVDETSHPMKARVWWYPAPELGLEYTRATLPTAPDLLYNQGQRHWTQLNSVSVTITSLKPCHGTITGVLGEYDALTDQGQGGPVTMTVTF